MLGFWNQPPGSQEMREAMEGPKQEATGREGRHMRGREEGKNLDVWSFAGGICLLCCTTLGMPPSHWRSFEKYPFRWATLPREQKFVSSLQGYFTCNDVFEQWYAESQEPSRNEVAGPQIKYFHSDSCIY